MMSAPDAIARLLAGNKAFARRTAEATPDLFPKLANGQSPEVLWIGCADSRVPETTVCACQPGDIFVHRNIANVVVPGDVSAASILDFAVGNLKAKKIVICGHTKCGGAVASLGDADLGENLNTWLKPVRELRRRYQRELDSLPTNDEKAVRLAELNVRMGLETLRKNPTVINAMQNGLTIHGMIYDIAKGELYQLPN